MAAKIYGLIRHAGRGYYILLYDKVQGQESYRVRVNKTETMLGIEHGKWTAKDLAPALSERIGNMIKKA